MSKTSEDREEFRLRPTRPRVRQGESAAWSKALSTVLLYARSSKRGGSGKSSAGRVHNQRCAVRVMYTANKVSGQWRAHGRYIAREGAGGDQRVAGFGTSSEEIPPSETLARWQSSGDPRLWKLIISPEFGERLDLARLTRDVMADMERDLGTKLEWVAVAHFNTEHPHVHVALRGICGDGSPLDLPRNYVRSGIRTNAERACTLQLGYRTPLDAEAARRREATAHRFTSLDRQISQAGLDDHERADASRFVYLEPPARKNENMIVRLRNLQKMGIAEEAGRGIWLVRRDFQTVLRAMQEAADRQKMLARHGALLSDPRLPMQVLDFRKLKMVEGRVLLHGEDEQTGRPYMMLEGIDGKVHIIQHRPEIVVARGQGELQPNSFVRLRRLFENGRPLLEVEDYGDADKLLRNQRFLSQAATATRDLAEGGQAWAGWLGRFYAAVEAEQLSSQTRSAER